VTPILMYHSLSSSSSRSFRPFMLHPVQFEQHARYLRDDGYVALTVSQLVSLRNQGCVPERAVVLTFDDGFADFHRSALPVLTRYGLTATLYVVSGYVGGSSGWLADAGSRPLLSWSQLADVRHSGVEIGAHTVSHPALDTLPPGQAKEEIASSKRELENGLGIAVRSFAYPYGYYSRAVRDLVVSAGYSSACAVRYAVSSPADDPFALCRQIVRHDTDVAGLAALLSDRAPRLRTLYDRTRSRAWARLRQSLYGRRSSAGACDGA
jgi:peptidoglycan/xylan/chitin deacetylase (PgdA/CDA1 family)